jgi:hypothetical protein
VLTHWDKEKVLFHLFKFIARIHSFLINSLYTFVGKILERRHQRLGERRPRKVMVLMKHQLQGQEEHWQGKQQQKLGGKLKN